MLTRRMKLAFPALLLLLAAACSDSAVAIAPSAGVKYVLDGPLCSSRFSVQFSIDNAVVGVDTFLVNIGPGAPHTVSKSFTVTTGQHLIGARGVGPSSSIAWPDVIKTLSSGQSFADTLSVYCS